MRDFTYSHHEQFGERESHGRRGGGQFGEGGGRRGGCGGGRGDRLERGAMRFVILDALRDGPKHGYEIIKGLKERTHGQYSPSPGRVYPILQFLNDLGLVRSDAQDDRRVYTLTDTGRAELEAQTEWLAEFWANFESAPASEPIRHETEFLQDELDSLSRTIWNGLQQPIARGDREAIRRARQLVSQCRDSIRDLVADSAEATGKPT